MSQTSRSEVLWRLRLQPQARDQGAGDERGEFGPFAQAMPRGGWYQAAVRHQAGDFVWTLTLTDIHTQWMVRCGTKGVAGVCAALADIEAALPFKLLGFDSDNGGEFLNWHLHDCLTNLNGSGKIQNKSACVPVRSSNSSSSARR